MSSIPRHLVACLWLLSLVAVKADSPVWISPENGGTYGRTNPLRVRVETSREIVGVDFFLGDTKIGRATTWEYAGPGTYCFTAWLTSNASGTYTISAKADDGFIYADLPDLTVHFADPGPEPVITMLPPDKLRCSSMTLRGGVDSQGVFISDGYFQISTTSTFTTNLPSISISAHRLRDPIPGAPPVTIDSLPDWQPVSSPVQFSQAVTDLLPETEYHYRLVVHTPTGYIYGPDTVVTTPANQAPVTKADIGVLQDNGTCIVYCVDNDSDDSLDDSRKLTIVSVSSAAHGTVEISQSGVPRVRYTADETFSDTDTFTYTVADQFGAQATGTVEIRSIAQHYVAIAGSYLADLTPDGGRSSIGTLAVTVTPTGSYSGNLTLNGVAHPFTGAFSPHEDGYFSSSTKLVTMSSMSFGFMVDYDPFDGTPEIAGGSMSGPFFDIFRTVVSMPPAEAAAEIGQFTALIPNPNEATASFTDTQPQGYGFATMKIVRGGKVTVVGRTGDNQPFSSGGRLRKDHQVFIRARTARKGQLSGTLKFDQAGGINGNGTVTWKNPANRGRVYQDPFSMTLEVESERFAPAKKASDLLSAGPTLQFAVKDHDGFVEGTKSGSWDTHNRVDTGRSDSTRLLVTLNPRTGIFSGTYRQISGAPRRLMGVLQPATGKGGGTVGAAGSDAPLELVAQ